MKIREFTEKDNEEITSLMRNLCVLKGQEFDEERWRKSLNDHLKNDSLSEVMVAFDEKSNLILAMVICSIQNSNNGSRFGYITNLIVKEESRRLGIGEELMRYIIDFFKRNHISSVRLALKQNVDKAAKTLFTKLGFHEILNIYELKI